MSANIIATLDTNQFYALNTLIAVNLKPTTNESIKFILGLLNSKLIDFYYQKFLKSTKKVFSEIQARQIAELPFPKIESNQSKEHDQIVTSVDQLLKLNKDLQAETLESKKEQIKRKIDHFEDKINELVYKLYDLTEEEIKIVEGG